MSFLNKIMIKPWEHAGEIDDFHGEFGTAGSAGRTGLWMFIAVVSSLFSLLIVSYYTRSQYPDWEVLMDPDILWINTVVLVMASIVLQLASSSAKRGVWVNLHYKLVAGAVLSLLFVAGQLMAWEQMVAEGFYAAENPANAFFYLLTGLHALHLLGGLWFMVLLGFRMKSQAKRDALGQSVALCATYWHYLLLVWLVLFAFLKST
jgi:cytochrome c oxidase subunit 3